MEQREQELQSGNVDNSTRVIPVIEEHLVVKKEVVETGKVRIKKTVTQEEATVNIPIIQEGYNIERRPGSKELYTQHPATRYEGDTMIIPVVREVVVVEKRFEVTEELHVTKTTTEVPHLQQVTLKKETVKVRRSSTRP